MPTFFCKSFPRSTKGFSTAELMISIGIFALLSGILTINYNNFTSRVVLDTLASEIAQSVREAQVLGLSAKRAGAVNLHRGFGLHFTENSNQFILFSDRDADQQYDAGSGACGAATTECEVTTALPNGYTIAALCGEPSSGTALVAPCPPLHRSSLFDIVFTRPNPDAVIKGNLNGAGPLIIYGRARITVTSPKNQSRVVEVWTTGQASVQ